MNWKWNLAQAAEIRWWKYYLAGKLPEDYLRDKAAYWQRVIKRARIQLPAGARVLDAGCGPAGIFMVLEDQTVDALDPLLEQYARELPHFDPAHYPGVKFLPESLENYQSDTSYDLIFCLNAINHVADIEQALDRLVACLAPQGTLWLSIDAHRHPGLRRIFQWLPGDILHPQQFTLEEYRQLLAQRGMSVVQSLKLKPGRIFDYYLLEANWANPKV